METEKGTIKAIRISIPGGQCFYSGGIVSIFSKYSFVAGAVLELLYHPVRK